VPRLASAVTRLRLTQSGTVAEIGGGLSMCLFGAKRGFCATRPRFLFYGDGGGCRPKKQDLFARWCVAAIQAERSTSRLF